MHNDDLSNTQKFDHFDKLPKLEVNAVILQAYNALKEKGYNPTNQIVGYIMSGDPAYITSHNGARSAISKFERDELLEEIINFYLEHNK